MSVGGEQVVDGTDSGPFGAASGVFGIEAGLFGTSSSVIGTTAPAVRATIAPNRGATDLFGTNLFGAVSGRRATGCDRNGMSRAVQTGTDSGRIAAESRRNGTPRPVAARAGEVLW